MIAMGYHTDQDDIGWRALLRSVIRFVRKPKVTANKKPSATLAWEENPELQKAILTFRMAANPGDDYDVIAARIESEAERYREFLRNPKPIGYIILNVKNLAAEGGAGAGAHEQYRVRDPAQGQAAVHYTFVRSDKLVLEFIVHDEHHTALFPIVRTYSTWLGKKKFNLGLGRTFHLIMYEGDSPERVCVQAGFAPFARQAALTPMLDAAAAQPLTAYTANADKGKGDLGFTTNIFSPSYGRSLALVLGMECLTLSVLCCLLFWWVVGQQSGLPVEVARASSPAATTTVSPPAAEETTADRDMGSIVPAVTTGLRAKEHRLVRLVGDREKSEGVKTREFQKAARLTKIESISVKVDGDSCHDAEGRCARLLSNFQKAIETNLSRFELPVHTSGQPAAERGAIRLVVSYKPVDDCLGHIYVTLFDQTGLLWGEEDDCFEYGEGNADDFVNVASEKISKRLANAFTQARAVIAAEGNAVTTAPPQGTE